MIKINSIMKVNKKAVLLLSGGLDSTTCLAIAKDRGFQICALTVNYGQKHKFELNAAKRVANDFKVYKHKIVNIDLAQFGGSSLTGSLQIPQNRTDTDMIDIPNTYVPARNTVLLSIALAFAETESSQNIFIGVNALDYSGYPDCRPEYISSFERTANLATKSGVNGKKFKVHTPLIEMKKSEIIKAGLKLGVDYSKTSSCYVPDKNGRPCGLCDACFLRLKGFKELAILDPLAYVT